MGFALPGSGTMSLPSEFMLTDVRCFAGEQRARLRPITLLVGENSTGKTTFLGCYSVLHRLFDWFRLRDSDPDFNSEPFLMGSFRDIVRRRRSPKDRIHSFRIGVTVGSSENGHGQSNSINVTFSESGSQPYISNIRYMFTPSNFLELIFEEDQKLIVKTKTGTITTDVVRGSLGFIFLTLSDLGRTLINNYNDQAPNLHEIVSAVDNFRNSPFAKFPDIVTLAPLRTKPKRTYDPIKEIISPDGEHVPMLMMRLDRTGDERWKPLHRSLSDFGQESGMFSDIRVRRLGKQMSDPFQLQVEARSGTPANIMDVGYGVSQSLPILVDINSHTRLAILAPAARSTPAPPRAGGTGDGVCRVCPGER